MPAKTPLTPYTLQTATGFPSPAQDYIDQRLDLNQLLVRNAPATFYMRVQGDSMRGAGIASGDLLVVDRSVQARAGSVVVACVDGELAVRRLKRGKAGLLLSAEDGGEPVALHEASQTEVWGVATHVIHALTRG